MFLLEQSWFFMNFIYRTFGIYPLERVGKVDLKPTSSCCFWFRYLVTFTLVMVILVVPIEYATNLQDFLLAFVAEIGVTAYDMISLAATFVTNFGLHVKCVSKLGNFKKRFSDLQHFVNTKHTMELKNNAYGLNFYKYLLPYLFFVVTATILNYMGWMYSMKLNLSNLETNLIITSACIYNFFFFNPLFYFTTLYIEVTIKLAHYCKMIAERSTSMILEESKILITSLKDFASMSSTLLLWIFSLNFIFAIIVAFFIYVKGTTTFSNFDIPWYDYCPIIGMVSTLVYLICMFYTYCSLSEDIANNVQNLKLEILKRGYQHGQVDYILQELDDFKGFDADGYFTVNHSLFTGMATNFATFLVILIQFKQAESPSV